MGLQAEVVLGMIASVSAVVFAAISFLRTRKSDNNKAGREIGTVMSELGYIRSGVDDIKRKQERQEENYVGVASRLSKVEGTLEAIIRRLDILERERSKSV